MLALLKKEVEELYMYNQQDEKSEKSRRNENETKKTTIS
jgi:hypothetical protein